MTANVIELSSRLTKQQQKWLVEAQPLITEIAASIWWRWRYRGIIKFEDLLSIGKVRAAERLRAGEFDESRGTLRQYLWIPVHGAMHDALDDESRAQSSIRRGAYKAVDVLVDEGDMEEFSDAVVAGMLLNLAFDPIPLDEPEEIAARKEMLTLLQRAVATLSAEQQRLIDLHYKRDLPLEAAGREMGMGRTVVKGRHRGLIKKLAAWFGRHSGAM